MKFRIKTFSFVYANTSFCPVQITTATDAELVSNTEILLIRKRMLSLLQSTQVKSM